MMIDKVIEAARKTYHAALHWREKMRNNNVYLIDRLKRYSMGVEHVDDRQLEYTLVQAYEALEDVQKKLDAALIKIGIAQIVGRIGH